MAKLSGPVGVCEAGGWLVPPVAEAPGVPAGPLADGDGLDPLPVHAARKAPNPATAEPWMKRRRLIRSWFGGSRGRSWSPRRLRTRQPSACRGRLLLDGGAGGPDGERVVRRPAQPDFFPRAVERAVNGSLDVLLIDGDIFAVTGLDDVLGRNPQVRRILHGPGQEICACRGVGALGEHPDLLRADADVDRRVSVGQVLRHPQDRVVREADRDVPAVGSVARLEPPRQQVADAEEPSHEAGGRAFVQALGVAQLLVAAATHDRDAIGHRHRLFLVVGHVDEGDPHFLLDPLELYLHLLAELQIQRAERLVEQQHGRPVDEGPCERHPLRLAAGDLGGPALLEARELHEVQHLGDPLLDLLVGDALPAQPEGDVVEDREVGKEGVVLEHRVDVPLVRRQPGDVLALQLDGSRRGLLEAADHPEGRGLAAPRWAEEAEELTVHDLEVDVVDGDGIAELLHHLDEPDVDGGHVPSHSCVLREPAPEAGR